MRAPAEVKLLVSLLVGLPSRLANSLQRAPPSELSAAAFFARVAEQLVTALRENESAAPPSAESQGGLGFMS